MTRKSRRRTDDLLWKAILEQTFAHFLTFFFPDADEVFDLAEPFEYLDKEFESLFPPEPNSKGVRYVDKLVKVRLKNEGEQFVLVHIEIQSSKGKGDLAERMFRYFYKIAEKYHVPITAIAILADDSRSYHPKVYRQEFMGTSLNYEFNSYKILDQSETELRANPNPFAVVVLTALLAIRHRKITDEELMTLKLDLYEAMVNREMDRDTRRGIYNFLTYYVNFEDEEKLSIFDTTIRTKIGRSDTMGTHEYLLDKWKKRGIKEGRAEERAKMEEEKLVEKLAQKRAIALEFKKMGIPAKDIAKGTGLSVEEIERLK